MRYRRALWRFAQFTVAWAAFVIFAGAMVTSTKSGMAVPDWPKSFGTWTPKMEGGVFYEHGHRMVAGALGLLVLVLAVWAWAVESRPWARVLTWGALFAVLIQASLGGITVLLGTTYQWLHTDPRVSSLHAGLAQGIFALLVAYATVGAPGWQAERERPPVEPRRAWTAAAVAFLVYVQIIVGALMRHFGAGLAITGFPLNSGRILPVFDSGLVWINFAHRVGAWILLLAGGFFAWRIARDPRLDAWARLPAQILLGALAVQFMLGAAAVWTLLSRPVLTSAHVVGGSVVFTSAVVLALRLGRLARRR
jgi:cytochrome c oxidase assembly protein subunit 15